MVDGVECYSGHTYAQEPRTVIWQEERHAVIRIDQRWRRPDGPAFQVLTESGTWFELCYSEHKDRWTVRALPGEDGSPVSTIPIEDKEAQ